jgi:GNAT superfamily N-acetyltransferase
MMHLGGTAIPTVEGPRMISVSAASTSEDFEIAAKLCHALGEWDAVEVQPYGVSREELLALFHSETSGSLAAKFSSPNAKLLVARWEGSPAGCLAFNPFDSVAVEFHKFYVDARFRGRGIGSALMRTALDEVKKGHHRTVLVHTTVYMKNAISVYEAFDFTRCPRFRETPESVTHTDFFMSRAI